MSSQRVVVMMAAALALGACSDTSGPSSNDLLNADVAVVAADAALEGIRMMQDPGMGMGSGFDRSRTVTFYDRNGTVQDAFDPIETESINIVTDVSGSVSRELWSATVERHRDMTVSGLWGEETTRTWNGTGNEKVVRSRHFDDQGVRTYDMTGDVTIDNVVVPVPGSEQRWPLSGTITRHMVVVITNGPNGDETRERTVVITFNGTQTVTMLVDGEAYEMDLGARPGGFPLLRGPRGPMGPRGRGQGRQGGP